MSCATSGRRDKLVDACKGDSGGPVVREVLAVNFSSNCLQTRNAECWWLGFVWRFYDFVHFGAMIIIYLLYVETKLITNFSEHECSTSLVYLWKLQHVSCSCYTSAATPYIHYLSPKFALNRVFAQRFCSKCQIFCKLSKFVCTTFYACSFHNF